MKTFAAAAFVASFLSLVSAQITYENGTFVCASSAPSAFCAGDSLSSNIIIRCTSGIGQPDNCNDNLAGVPPVGVKSFALCYQSSPIAGDGACSFNGIAYPDSGASFPIPGSSQTIFPTGTAAPTYTASGSAVPTPSSNATISLVPSTPTPTLFEGGAGTRSVGWATLLGALGLGAAML
ncbi:hypothetical protein MMC14_001151 [Varicellaria rhodocarpa]|nr:hypothetical protein [Varicellaria rhodocarpa]